MNEIFILGVLKKKLAEKVISQFFPVLHSIYESRNSVYLIMDHIEGQTLESFLRINPRGVEDDRVAMILEEAVECLFHLHSCNIVHRDLKPENIIVTPEFKIKIVDFGFSTDPRREYHIFISSGTPGYIAPELLNPGGKVSCGSDIFSLGSIIYELLKNKALIGGETIQEIQDNNKNFNRKIDGLVGEMLQSNPKERITLEELRKILNNMNNDAGSGLVQLMGFE